MTTYIYNSKDNTVREKATMAEPLAKHYRSYDEWLDAWNAYCEHGNNLRTYPCTEACKVWEDGKEVVEWEDFIIVDRVMGKHGIADLINPKESTKNITTDGNRLISMIVASIDFPTDANVIRTIQTMSLEEIKQLIFQYR